MKRAIADAIRAAGLDSDAVPITEKVETAPGDDGKPLPVLAAPYSPMRGEWIEVAVNASESALPLPHGWIRVSWVPPDAFKILARYAPTTSRETLNTFLDSIRKTIQAEATGAGLGTNDYRIVEDVLALPD